MSHTESSLMRLNEEDLVRVLLDYQGKLHNILDELKNNLNELKTKFCKLESYLHISRNVNDKLSDKLVVLEQKRHANEQNSRRECLEISGILAEVWDKDIEKIVLEDCHRIPSKGSPQKLILKLSCRKDSRRVLPNKKKLKQLKPESLSLPVGVKIYINESLCPYLKIYGKKAENCGMSSKFCHFGSVMDP